MKTTSPTQLDMWSAVASAARHASGQPRRALQPLVCDLDLRRTLNDAIRNCGRSREEIADAMAQSLGDLVTKSQIDAWTAESKSNTHRIPASYLPAFCDATGSTQPMELLATLIGRWLCPEQDKLFAAQGKLMREEEDLRKRKRLLKSLLETTEVG
ncbi:MAG: hypothetical protein HUU55_22045 [Myxococcales bacterium]|nr:hypothetical protein [Myxococcales bacterium]